MPITTVAIYFVIRPTYCAISTQPNMDHEYVERISYIPMSIGRVFFEIFRIILNQGRLTCYLICETFIEHNICLQEDTFRICELLFILLRVVGVWSASFWFVPIAVF